MVEYLNWYSPTMHAVMHKHVQTKQPAQWKIVFKNARCIQHFKATVTGISVNMLLLIHWTPTGNNVWNSFNLIKQKVAHSLLS